jgi:uncharacterized membrane protein YadS
LRHGIRFSLDAAVPSIARAAAVTPHAFGLWAGASIHEIAQVVAAAFQNGPDSGNFGTIAKLSRVMLLAPMILVLGCLRVSNREHDRGEASKPQSVPVPWFVTGLSQ